MIAVLKQVLPYPTKWYTKMHDEKLTALYLQHKDKPSKRDKQVSRGNQNTHEFIPADPHPQIRKNEETGETEIYTDGGFWVQMD